MSFFKHPAFRFTLWGFVAFGSFGLIVAALSDADYTGSNMIKGVIFLALAAMNIAGAIRDKKLNHA